MRPWWLAAPHNELLCRLFIVRGDGGHQRALAQLAQRDGIVQVGVRHQRAHGAEGFHLVALQILPRLVVAQQDGAHEGALLRVRAGDFHALRIAVHQRTALQQLVQVGAHFLALRQAHERAHAHTFRARIADHRARQALADGLLHIFHQIFRHHDPAHAGATLAALQRHLAAHFLHEQVEFRRARHGIRRQHDAVQAVGLHVEGHALGDDARMHLQLAARAGAAGEGHHVLAFHMVQQVARAAHDQLQAALGQQAGFVHQAHAWLR